MKIVIALSTLQSGGAERVAVLWAEAFIRAGHQVMLATNKTRDDEPFVYSLDERVEMWKCWETLPTDVDTTRNIADKVMGKIGRFVRNEMAIRRNLRACINSFCPDVIIGLMERVSLQCFLAAYGTGIPVVATMHNSFERPKGASLTMTNKIYKFWVNRLYPLVTVLTEADKRVIGSRMKHVFVLPNPLALPPVSSSNRLKKKRIVAAGRLDDWSCKGFDVLIKAWGMIAEKHPEWTLDIAGESHRGGHYIRELEQMIKESRCEGRCQLSGFHKNMTEFFGESEIFVLSSRYEGFGLVLIEAMSQGCACIAADYKGRQREIVTDDTMGLCVPPEDVKALANAMERMINDDKYRHEVQAHAIDRAKAYSPDFIEKKWEELLDKVVKKQETI